uniref:Uncharacterized protein n=1 Tax=Mus spicilegus TaxID=10103 RepID=A0A8C6GZF6_MUSSI
MYHITIFLLLMDHIYGEGSIRLCYLVISQPSLCLCVISVNSCSGFPPAPLTTLITTSGHP